MAFAQYLDYGLLNYLHSLATQGGISFFELITFFGGTMGIGLVTVGAIYYFSAHHKSHYIWPLVLSIIGNTATIYILKHLIARPRPIGGFLVESGYAFPSGHTASALLLYGFLLYVYMSYQHDKQKLRAIQIGCVLLILLIGVSRLYLGVHFLSDVLAGYVVGAFWLLVALRKRNFRSLDIGTY